MIKDTDEGKNMLQGTVQVGSQKRRAARGLLAVDNSATTGSSSGAADPQQPFTEVKSCLD
jgi:hypothetical protein